MKRGVDYIGVGVGAIIINARGELFMARRGPQAKNERGLWEFPGGSVEYGERLADALRREIREELDIDIEVGEPFGIYRHGYTHFKVTLHAFLCQIVSGEPRALEASEITWAAPADLPTYPMGKIDRQIARRILNS